MDGARVTVSRMSLAFLSERGIGLHLESARSVREMMNGMMPGMWIWWAVGILLIVFIVVAILKVLKK